MKPTTNKNLNRLTKELNMEGQGLFLECTSKLINEAKDQKPFTAKEAKLTINHIIEMFSENDSFNEQLAYYFINMARKHGFDDETIVDKDGNNASQAINDIIFTHINDAIKSIETELITKNLNSIKPYDK